MLPPHTSHRTQPLDTVYFGPLKKAFNSECDNFLKTLKANGKVSKIITPYDLAGKNKIKYLIMCLLK